MTAAPGTDASATSLATPLSAAQHKESLWADRELQVYGVVMGSRVADMATRLAIADVPGFDCLWPGALAPSLQRDAPYLVQLAPESPSTDWLLFEADAAFGDWGVLVRSAARLMPLRNHLRRLLEATLPGGQRIALDWMDPAVLLALLPHFGPADLAAFFGPVRTLIVPTARSWRHAEWHTGRLVQHDVPLQAEA